MRGRVTVPRASLREANPASGGMATLRAESPDGGWADRTVRLGLVGPDRVEIQRGLREGESYLAGPPEG